MSVRFSVMCYGQWVGTLTIFEQTQSCAYDEIMHACAKCHFLCSPKTCEICKCSLS